MTFFCTTKYYSSTTLYYEVLLQYYSVLQSTTAVLQSTTLYYSSTTLYYKVLLQYYSVLLQYYSVLQSTTPVLLCTTKYNSSTTLYYKALLQYYVKPCRNISVNSLRPERSQIYAPSDPKFTPEAIQNLRPKRPRARKLLPTPRNLKAIPPMVQQETHLQKLPLQMGYVDIPEEAN